MYKLDVTPVVGLPQFTGWSQVVSHPTNRGELVCAFSVSGEHAGNVGRDVMEMIESSPANSAVELHQLLADLNSFAQEVGVNLTVACGIFSSQKMILGVESGSVFLKRGDRSGVLLNSQRQLKIVEGKRLEEDMVVLSTPQAGEFLNEVGLKFDRGFEVDSIISSILPGIHGLDDSSLASMAFIGHGQEVEMSSGVKGLGVAIEVEDEVEDEVDLSRFDPDKFQYREEELSDEELGTVAEDEVGDLSGEVEPEIKAEPKSETPFIDIPPALKLRGAGKRRSSQAEKPAESTAAKQSETSEELAALGIGQAETTQPKPAGQVVQAILIGLKKFFSLIKSLLAKLGGVLVKLPSIILKVAALPKRLVSRDVYLNSNSPRKIIRTLLPFIIGLLVIGGLVAFQLLRMRQQVRAVEADLSPLQQQLQTAEAQVAAEPILARETVAGVVADMEQLQTKYKGQRSAQKRLEEELTAAQGLLAEISGKEEFNQLEVFYDLRLVESDFVTAAVDAGPGRAVFLDKERQQVIVLNLENKQHQTYNYDQLDQLRDFKLMDEELFLLSQGVHRAELAGEAEAEEVIAEGDSNRAGTHLAAYVTYIYVLNPEKREIYRYAEREDGYSEPIGWVSGAARFDYNQVTSMMVDGDIWITTREGGLHKLSSGAEVDFEIVGLEEPFQSSIMVFTTEEMDELYLLEPDQSRLVILSKEGEFLREIKSASLASTTALFVSPELNQAFAVSGSIVYAISL